MKNLGLFNHHFSQYGVYVLPIAIVYKYLSYVYYFFSNRFPYGNQRYLHIKYLLRYNKEETEIYQKICSSLNNSFIFKKNFFNSRLEKRDNILKSV